MPCYGCQQRSMNQYGEAGTVWTPGLMISALALVLAYYFWKN